MAPPRLPPGYHFRPSAEELVHGYLDPWIAGQPLGELATVVCVADVYSCDPATLTERFKEFGHDGKHWYFLCVAKRKGRGHISRGVEGGGCWKGTHGIRAGVGQQSFFKYRDADDRSTGWIMTEFYSGLAAAADDQGVKVICKVYLSPRRPATTTANEHAGAKRPATTTAEEERRDDEHVGAKRPATIAEEERRDDKVVEDASNLAMPVPDMVDGAWSQPQYGGAFIKMEELKPLVMVRPNGEVLRFGQPDSPEVLNVQPD